VFRKPIVDQLRRRQHAIDESLLERPGLKGLKAPLIHEPIGACRGPAGLFQKARLKSRRRCEHLDVTRGLALIDAPDGPEIR
jgi:hypothetical protein